MSSLFTPATSAARAATTARFRPRPAPDETASLGGREGEG